jgi:hypothetical protein
MKVEHAIESARRAVEYFGATRERDGSWRDFAEVPVGPSDQWVTAYVGLALAHVRQPVANELAQRAATWLEQRRARDGWGYNDRAGPDADSTAHAMLLFDALGRGVPREAAEFAMGHQCAHGGFATYRRSDAWGRPHACVTGAVCEALMRAERAFDAAPTRRWLRETANADGDWSAYWWTASRYATMTITRWITADGRSPEASNELLACNSERQRLERSGASALRSCFDVACEIEVLRMRGAPRATLEGKLRALLWRQRADGSWPGSACLLISPPDASAPSAEATDAARVFTDWCSTITTATCLRAVVGYQRSIESSTEEQTP